MKRYIYFKYFSRNLFFIILLCSIISSCDDQKKIEHKSIEAKIDSIYFHKRVQWSTPKMRFIEIGINVYNKTDTLLNYNLLKQNSGDSTTRFYIKTKNISQELKPREYKQKTLGVLKAKDSINWIFELKDEELNALSLQEMHSWFMKKYGSNSVIVLKGLNEKSIEFKPDFENSNPIFILDLERVSQDDSLKINKGKISPEELKKLFEK